MSVPPPGDVAPPLANGRYRLVAVLGEGGQAVVYRAWDQRLRVWRAIKLLDRGAPRSLRARFEAEARTLARLRHPSLLVVHDVAEDDGRPFMVAHLAAESLHDRLVRLGPMPAPLACAVLAQVADALSVAHDAGVVHRDIKPSNVLVDTAGTPLVADFGIARVFDERRTRAEARMGTVAYMAPEQRVDASAVDARADVYSVGATLYAALTGRDPTGPMEDLSDAALAEVPAPLRRVLRRATARDPAARHPTARGLRDDLIALAGGRPSAWVPPEIRLDPPPEATPTWADPAAAGPAPAAWPRRAVLLTGAVGIAAAGLGVVGLAVVLAAGGALWASRSAPAEPEPLPVHRLTTHPPDLSVHLGGVSADGADVVYTTDGADGTAVWRRAVDRATPAAPVASGLDPAPPLRLALGEHLELIGWTDDPAEPPSVLDRRTGRSVPLVQTVDDIVAASPDGAWIAWARVSGGVFRAPIAGGRPATVYQAPPGRVVRGLAWSPGSDALALVLVGPEVVPTVVVAAADGTASAQVYTNAALDDAVTGAVPIVWPQPDTLLVGERDDAGQGLVRTLHLAPGARAERGPVLVQLDQRVAELGVGGRTLAIVGAQSRDDTWLATVRPDGRLGDPREALEGDDTPVGWLGTGELVATSTQFQEGRIVLRPHEGPPETLTRCPRALVAGDGLAVLMAEGCSSGSRSATAPPRRRWPAARWAPSTRWGAVRTAPASSRAGRGTRWSTARSRRGRRSPCRSRGGPRRGASTSRSRRTGPRWRSSRSGSTRMRPRC